MAKRKRKTPPRPQPRKQTARSKRQPLSEAQKKKIYWTTGGLALLLLFIYALTSYESYASLYDATYVGSERCGDCHTQVYAEWEESPHAWMTRQPSETSVVGNFDNFDWHLPDSARLSPADERAIAKMMREGKDYYMALWHSGDKDYKRFKVDYVVGYQYRQTYLTRETGGVLRRLPLQWSVDRREFFPYWNLQEGSLPSADDFHAQMQSQNSAWNLFCARCHTTNLEIAGKDIAHTVADVSWTDAGIGCEACHGPGSQHTNYFEGNYINRIAAFANSKLRGEPVAYIATANKLSKGQDLSVCARCHGADIYMGTTDVYRIYEPGYSRIGKTNDLSDHFKQVPLQAGRKVPTVECWDDGRPKGVGMLFRSFIESACYEKAEVRCYNCHNPHANKSPRATGLLEPSEISNSYCLSCHTNLEGKIAEHTKHTPGKEGSFCYDCHMPRDIMNMVSGTLKYSRTHDMSSIPNPENSIRFGVKGSPNACNECHSEQIPEWAKEKYEEWWGGSKETAAFEP